MDYTDLQNLAEAYQQVYDPQKVEEVESEAYEPMTKERQMKVDRAKKKAYDADHRARQKGDSAESDKQFKRRMAMDSRTKMRKEELDIFDTVLEFLYAEGYVDTAEEAEWMMANLIDEEAIDIILDEALTGDRYKKAVKKPGGTAYSRRVSADPAKRATRGGRGGESDFGSGDRGSGNKSRRRRGLSVDYDVNEAFEAWLDEAMSSYDRNRKRAAQRAAARNAARAAGKTGAVPGVGYVTPRRERETYTDEKGTVRHKSGAKMP